MYLVRELVVRRLVGEPCADSAEEVDFLGLELAAAENRESGKQAD